MKLWMLSVILVFCFCGTVSADTVTISTVADWVSFAQRVNSGENGLDAVLTTDVDLGANQTMVGTTSNRYSGRFDGRGHTLTVHYETDVNDVAPFRYVSGGRIYNLHTAGTINTSKQYAAGIASWFDGEGAAIFNCRSSIIINSSYEGSGFHGGIAAMVELFTQASVPAIGNCLFDGKLLTDGGTTSCGGFVGFIRKAVKVVNCLYAPATVEEGETAINSGSTFFPSNNDAKLVNSYYTATMGTAHGIDASSLSPNELAAQLGSGWHVSDAKVLPIHNHQFLQGTGSSDNPFLISSEEDWNLFADDVCMGLRLYGKSVKLTADIHVGKMACDPYNKLDFSGSFDGGFHTLNLDLSSDGDYCAPFMLGGGSIRNVHTTGTIHTGGRYASGLSGYMPYSGTEISNCWSSVTIISSYEGEGRHGGLVAYVASGGGVIISDCLFDGKFITTNGTTRCGGIVGYATQNLQIYNSLSTPSEPSDGEIGCSGSSTLYNLSTGTALSAASSNYSVPVSYTTEVQGEDASSLTADEIADMLGASWTIEDGKPIPFVTVTELIGSGTSSDPYLIRHVEDWKALAANVSSGNTYFGKEFLMTSDIDLGDCQIKVGTRNHGFSGNFNGGGHILTIHYVSNADYCAPFSRLQSNNHVFRNLHVAGTINTSGKHAAGIIGNNDVEYLNVGTTTLISCRSSVVITSSTQGEGRHGGLIGCHTDQLNLIDCLFDGSILGPSTTECAGLLGYNEGNSVQITNCLYNPKDQTVGTENSKTLYGYWTSANINVTNSYYTRTLGTAQGTDGSGMTRAELAEALGAAWVLEEDEPVPYFAPTITLKGSGTEEDPYLIENTEDWNNVCHNVRVGASYQNLYFRQTNDITVSQMIGVSINPFRGIYDGDGHTLTFNGGSAETPVSEENCAPFLYVGSSAIKNLHVDGTIFTSRKFAAGLIANIFGDVTITNCLNTVSINSSVSGDGTHGGFIAVVSSGTVNVSGCVFAGKLLGSDTGNCGGFVGWTESDGKVNFTDCLFAPQEVTFSSADSKTYSRARNLQLALTFENAGYAVAFGTGTAQGNKYVKLNLNGELQKLINVDCGELTSEYVNSKLSVYGKAMNYDGTIYLKENNNFTVSFVENRGYQFNSFSCVGEGASIVDATANPATLHVGSSDVELSVDATFVKWSGEGTAENPYIINFRDQLDWLAMSVNESTLSHYTGKYFILVNDLEYDGTENNYTPIGCGGGITTYFGGNFDGNGHTISGININSESGRQGLFGVVGEGVVKNVTLKNSTIAGNGDTHSGIVGHLFKGGVVENCHVDATVSVSGRNYVGGIVASNSNGTVSGCTSAASVSASSYAGGITGSCGNNTTNPESASESKVENCIYYGTSITCIQNGNGAISGNSITGAFSEVDYTHNYYTSNDFSGVGGIDVTTNNGAVHANVYTLQPNNLGDVVVTYKNSPEAETATLTAYTNGIGYAGSYYMLRGGYNLVNDDRSFPDEAKNGAIIAACEGMEVDITLAGRTLNKNGSWNTLCLPFDVDDFTGTPLDGATVKKLESSSYTSSTGTLKLNFTDVASITAGTPYLVMWSSDASNTTITNPVFTGVTLSNVSPTEGIETSFVTFVGNYSTYLISGEDKSMLYMGADNNLYYPNAAMAIGAFRAYFNLNGITAGDLPNGANGIILNFNDEGTGIISILDGSIRNVNGNNIPANQDWSTLGGTCLNGKPTAKGIYIHHGRKVVVP